MANMTKAEKIRERETSKCLKKIADAVSWVQRRRRQKKLTILDCTFQKNEPTIDTCFGSCSSGRVNILISISMRKGIYR